MIMMFIHSKIFVFCQKKKKVININIKNKIKPLARKRDMSKKKSNWKDPIPQIHNNIIDLLDDDEEDDNNIYSLFIENEIPDTDDNVDIDDNFCNNSKLPKIIAIDPAPFNCGISLYNLETQEFEKIIRKSFISYKENETDIGNSKLINAITKYIDDDKDNIFSWENDNDVYIFIENQTLGKENSNSSGNKGKDAFSNAKNLAVQYSIQSYFKERVIPIGSSSIKSHFREHFPLVEDKKKQYREDKKNAIIFGKTLISERMERNISNKYHGKEDDVYDSVVMIQYVLEMFYYDRNSKKFIKKPKSKKKQKDKELLKPITPIIKKKISKRKHSNNGKTLDNFFVSSKKKK